MENVTMTAEERQEFEAYRAEKQKKEAAAQLKMWKTRLSKKSSSI